MNDDPAAEAPIQGFILSRDLAEVYLLMDHLSNDQNRRLPDIKSDPVFPKSKGDWVEQICAIAWPPVEKSRESNAVNAAKLIHARDILNRAAFPANGTSIAWTLLMSGEASRDSYLTRLYKWLPSRSADDVESGNSLMALANWPPMRVPSRTSLAQLAHPGLARRAASYRLGMMVLLLLVSAWLIMTCALSWDVATGSALLNRFNDIDSKILTSPGPGSQHSTGTDEAAAGAIAAAQTKSASTDDAKSAEILKKNLNIRYEAEQDLEIWLQQFQFIRAPLITVMGGEHEQPRIKLPSEDKENANIEWAAVLLGILAGIILPIFYGGLGAGAAVIRGIWDKIRQSTLMPRDIFSAYIQLSLGALIGACVGLFVNPDGNATPNPGGFLGAVHLSVSALCFLAGFGVEGVFLALEAFVRRVFAIK